MSDAIMNKGKIKTWDYFFFGIAFLCLLIPKSWAGIFAYGAFMMLFFFRKSAFLKKMVNVRSVFIIIVLLFILDIRFNFQTHFEKNLNIYVKVRMNSI